MTTAVKHRRSGDSKRHALPPEWWLEAMRVKFENGTPEEKTTLFLLLIAVIRLISAAHSDD